MAIATPRSVETIPVIRPGEVITASYLNRIGRIINRDVLRAPRDVDSGAGNTDEVGGVQLVEQRRTSDTVRIENPSDDSQFVDVERARVVYMRRTDTGEPWELYFSA